MGANSHRSPSGKSATVYDIVTEQVLGLLDKGTVPWHQPWDPTIGLPKSLSTGKAYRGVNVFLLGMAAMAQGYGSPYWATYEAIRSGGGQVRKGEKSTLVVLWKRIEPKNAAPGTGAAGKGITPDDDTEKRSPFMLRYFRVFNTEQSEPGLSVPVVETSREHEPVEACEAIVKGYRNAPSISHGGPRAFYSPSRDHVQLPPADSFESADAYYSTTFHELTHSTGHGKRLDREGVAGEHSFGDPVYSREELVAEMGAAMLSGVAGIEQRTVGSSASYISSWLGVLRGDPKLVVSAAAAAQRAADLILGREWELSTSGGSEASPAPRLGTTFEVA